jgi:hypothetical protein
VRPKKRWYVENGDRVTGPELPGHGRQIHAERRALRNDDEGSAADFRQEKRIDVSANNLVPLNYVCSQLW